MADYLRLDPDQLRVYAEQLDRYAAAMRKWGEIPEEWLQEYPDGYGTIADPMHGALKDYYQKRHDQAEAQAASAERTRDDLRAAAERMENSELSGGQQISKAGPHGGQSPVANHPPTPSGGKPSIPGTAKDLPRTPESMPDIDSPPVGTAHSDGVTVPPVASAAQHGNDSGPALAAPNIGTPGSSPQSAPGLEDHHDGSAPGLTHVAPGGVVPSTAGYERAGQPDAPTAGAAPPAVGAAAAGHRVVGPASEAPRPLRPGPLTVAAQPPQRHRQGLPSLVVGEDGEDDLTLARTLLSAVLFAVGDTAPGVEWATAVVRVGRRAIIALTSTEGRGWLPPGLFVPSEVLIPWRWDSLLDNEGRTAITAFENNPDPAGFLADFGRHISRTKRGRLRALASSASVDDSVRGALGREVAIADEVPARETAVDLSCPGVGLADRLDMGGSAASRHRATEIADTDIRSACLQLAHAADELVRQVVPPASPAISAQRAWRHHVLESLHAGHEVPTGSWRNNPAAEQHNTAAPTAVFAPPAVSRQALASPAVSAGVAQRSSGTDLERGRTFERRADELISLLLAGKGDRQMLRDILYAYDQIAAHPQLPNMIRKADIGAVDAGSAIRGATVASIGEYSNFLASPELQREERSAR